MKQKSSLCNADEQLRCIVRKLSIVGNRRFANDIQFNANSWKFNIFESFLNYRILEGCARVYICVKFDSDELWKILKYRKIFRGIWLVFNLVSNFGWNRENSWNYLKVFFVLVLYNKTTRVPTYGPKRTRFLRFLSFLFIPPLPLFPSLSSPYLALSDNS